MQSNLQTTWKIPTRKIKIQKGKTITEIDQELNYQIDDLGNIYQREGGVIPKACQSCTKEFDAKIEYKEIKQKVPHYKCKNCDFTSVSPQEALDHKLLKENHKLKIKNKERVVDIQTQLIGRKANIILTNDDAIILCDDCK